MRQDSVQGMEITLHVGCPNKCDYCPQNVLLSKYQGERTITLEDFQKCMESVPTTRHLTFMGQVEQFVNPNATKIILWAHSRGYQMSISTTLSHTTHEDIDALAHVPFRTTVIHVPANDGRIHMPIDDAYIERLKHAINAWKHHRDFIISVFGIAHPKVLPIWHASGIPIVNFGLNNRAGNLPNWPNISQAVHGGSLPLCGKYLCGQLLPNGDVCMCCDDYGLTYVWGNLKTQTYDSLFQTDKFKKFIKSLSNPNFEVICRHCHDSFKTVNPEDISRLQQVKDS